METSTGVVFAKFIDRHSLVLSTAFLNGNKARISGIRNDFATVTDSTTNLSAEFAWATVERIVRNGGQFKS